MFSIALHINLDAWTEVSGFDIEGIMETWTTKKGFPYLKVSKLCSISRYQICL